MKRSEKKGHGLTVDISIDMLSIDIKTRRDLHVN